MFKQALILTLGLSAAPAFSTTYSSSHVYATQLNFSATAWGKEVAGVYAHTGILTTASSWRGGQIFWQDVQHVHLEKAGDHFFAKAIVRASSEYEYQYVSGPIVQYWVYFADGTQMVTDAVMVPVENREYASDSHEHCTEIRAAQTTEFEAISDAVKTQARETICTTTG